jgi:hypothetical protein
MELRGKGKEKRRIELILKYFTFVLVEDTLWVLTAVE